MQSNSESERETNEIKEPKDSDSEICYILYSNPKSEREILSLSFLGVLGVLAVHSKNNVHDSFRIAI